MFVTRAGRHDKADLVEFIRAQTGAEIESPRGTAMIAREGRITGCVVVVEVAPNRLVYDHLVVEDGGDPEVVGRLVEAAMNNKGGTIYVAAEPGVAPVLGELGFSAMSKDDAPAEVRAHWDASPATGSSCFTAR